MKTTLTIPVCVDHHRNDEGRTFFRARPVFPAEEGIEEETDVREDRALKRLGDRLRAHLANLASGPDHRALQAWSWCPPLTAHHLKMRIELRKRSVEGGFFLVVFEEAGRRLAHVPRGGLSFEWPQGVQLREVAQRVITEHFRQLERESEEEFQPGGWFCGSQPHLTHLPVVLNGRQRLPVAVSSHAFFSGDEPVDGAQELRKVARCLDRLYPRDLHRALLRDDEVGQLWAAFRRSTIRTPMVMLVGRPKSGKTAILHEYIRKSIETPGAGRRGQHWLVSPQRVISGMSYLGQWEARWNAMLTAMRQARHVLVLDDVLGLFQAGRTSGSDLTLGHVLKARQEHEPIPVLAECTPEVWGRLRELDRAFASLFQVIHVRETGDDATLSILVRTLQTLSPACSFAPGVLTEILRLQNRFGRAQAFPGKAVDMLQALANAFTPALESTGETPVTTASEVLRWFAQRQGINSFLLDAGQCLQREELRARFQASIMGQRAAIEAMVDVVLMAAAEVHDPRRPLGTLLFLGPTGVGKTECAKELARCVFESEERLIRFDLNEYTGHDASLRLIGGPGRAGLLTSKVRRQPFSLLLFDEVEKAHPDVFDLLLQVLGEGRLTDALGQTTDFCNCIIILTSNLGAKQARHRLGFATQAREDAAAYVEAAEKFFRPEFFNRLDRIVPFHELGRADIQSLAGMLANRAVDREGFAGSHIAVEMDDTALQFLADKGHDEAYGARALRRAVETHLVEPLSTLLGTAPAGRSVRLTISGLHRDRLDFDMRTQRQAPFLHALPPAVTREELRGLLDEAFGLVSEVEDRLDQWDFGTDEDSGISKVRAWYYRLRDGSALVRQGLQKLEDVLEREERARRRAAHSRAHAGTPPSPKDRLHLLPRTAVEGALECLLAKRLAACVVDALLAQAVPLEGHHASALRLLWRARHLRSVCQESFAEPVAWSIEVAPLPDWAWSIFEVGEAEPAQRPEREWSLLGWAGETLTDLAWRPDLQKHVLEGHGIGPLVAASCGVVADIHEGQMFQTPIEAHCLADGTPLPIIDDLTWLRLNGSLVDLRTGLVMKPHARERGEMAMAVCHGQPSTIPGTPCDTIP